ncbi:MAG: hypothetical protein P4M01_03570 [Acidobacteriota bacterium]|nr:hypothetical protein [Acidobacteriota bacterium]
MLALLYAIFAGLRTVGDPDLGWQLATGRWIAQHHAIPFTDVLSYTAHGRQWSYPVLSQLLLYAAYKLGGYALLSWLGALACAGTVALLARGGGVAALLALLAVPSIAGRTCPRAEMFTELLFAAFVSLLWNYRRTGLGRLWLLPLLMIAWVNLHPGFVAGLGMCGAYIFLELDNLLPPADRRAAWQRVRKALPWLAATAMATLVSPWGWRIYTALARQNDIMRVHGRFISEWLPQRVNAATLWQSAGWRNPEGAVYWLAGIAVVVIAIALWRRQPCAALLLGASTYLALHANRMEAPFAAILVVLGASLLVEGWNAAPWAMRFWRQLAPAAAPVLLVILLAFTGIRMADLLSNRYYLRTSLTSVFGAGESSWFPRQASEFLLRENLPSQIVNDFNSGGYLTWALQGRYEDSLDGRAVPFGAEFFLHSQQLMAQPLDSPAWQQEAERQQIRTVIVSVDRMNGRGALASLENWCRSQQWRPVYLDTNAAIFVRALPETADLIRRLQIDCWATQFNQPPAESGISGRARQYEYWMNAATIDFMLDRDNDVLAALSQAETISAQDPFLHYLKGVALQNTWREQEGENELRRAVELGSEDASMSLARYYHRQRRYAEEAQVLRAAAGLSLSPYIIHLKLGYALLAQGLPRDALAAFDQADAGNPYKGLDDAGAADFVEKLTEGRRQAALALQQASH